MFQAGIRGIIHLGLKGIVEVLKTRVGSWITIYVLDKCFVCLDKTDTNILFKGIFHVVGGLTIRWIFPSDGQAICGTRSTLFASSPSFQFLH